MKKTKRIGLRTWIEIDIKAIAHNLKIFRSLVSPNCRIMSVVKSNAYGHGLVGFSQAAGKLGVDYFGVDSAVEGITLRKNGIKKPILVLGYTLPELIEKAVANNLSLSISSFDALDVLINSNFKKPVKIHIKVDTGMHRQGFLLNESNKLIEKLEANKKKLL